MILQLDQSLAFNVERSGFFKLTSYRRLVSAETLLYAPLRPSMPGMVSLGGPSRLINCLQHTLREVYNYDETCCLQGIGECTFDVVPPGYQPREAGNNSTRALKDLDLATICLAILSADGEGGFEQSYALTLCLRFGTL